MTGPGGMRRVGIVGRDAYADALVALTRGDAPDRLSGVEPVAWWPGADDASAAAWPMTGPTALAGLRASSLSALWTAPGVDLLFLCGDAGADPVVAHAVAASGLEVVGLLPMAPAVVAAAPPAVAPVARASSVLRASAAGTAVFAAVEGGTLGPVRLFDLERRVAGDPGAPGEVLRRWAWAAVELACAVFGGLPERAVFHGGAVLAGRRDHLHATLRFAGDEVATIDVIELPAWSGVRDLQLELVGERGAWRWRPPFAVPERTPYATLVVDPAERLHAGDAVRRLFGDLRARPAAASRVAPAAVPATLAYLARLEDAWRERDEGVLEGAAADDPRGPRAAGAHARDGR